jgi:hypothetical protein
VFNNGPGGNFTQLAWKTGEKLVNGIELTPNANAGQSEDTWTKVTCSGTEIGVLWSVQWYKHSCLLLLSIFCSALLTNACSVSGIVMPIPIWPNMQSQVAQSSGTQQ